MTDTNTSATHGLFAELLEGAKALEERPTIIAERDRAKSEVEFHKSRVDEYRGWHDDMAAQISALKAQIAAQEADLASATFREGQVRGQLEMLVGAFKTVVGEAQAAVELIEPKPEPVPEPMTTTSEPNILPFTDQGQEASQARALSDTSGISQDTSSSTPLPFEATDTIHATGEISRNTEASGPFAATNETDPFSTAGTATASTGISADTPNAPGKPYWAKPTPMTWRTWMAQGGERPRWVEDAQLDTAY